MTKLVKTEFNISKPWENSRNSFTDDWPVVYILNGAKNAYIGQTSSYIKRMNTHLNNKIKRENLDTSYRIEDETFNNSVALDLESFLIEYISSDGKYELLNGNAGLRDHNYYERKTYREKFQDIWNLLKQDGVVQNDLNTIRNSEIFKMSPFKSLSSEQENVVVNLIRTLSKHETSLNVISGNPGTGKTVLAVYLMKYLIDTANFKGKKIGIVVPMTSLRDTLKRVFKNVKGLKPSMVVGPYDVVKSRDYDVLIVDEAHRLTRRKKLSNYKSFDDVMNKLNLSKDSNQLEWLKRSTKHLILFYDSNQTVKPSDVETKSFESLTKGAYAYTLSGQFRVKTNFDYPKFIENLLTKKERELPFLDETNLGEYDLKVFDSIRDLKREIDKKENEVGLSRIVSGYSWEWKSKKNKDVYDIQIDGLSLRWNSVNSDWINSENSINEVGCIHTVQGYDLNYCGVIIGEDLKLRDGKIIYDKSHYKDLKLEEADMKVYILNIYKVLLTRGIYGTYIYVCDEELRKYFKSYLPIFKSETYKEMRVAESKGRYE